MVVANAPVAFLGEALARRLPVRAVHLVAAIVFAALGVGVLVVG
jgi:putative Ca2+/H+ antiporter (TMEM165/GDT1 family)